MPITDNLIQNVTRYEKERLLRHIKSLFDEGSQCITYMRVKNAIEELRKELEREESKVMTF